jgi:predicted aspartyl protease
MGSIRPLLAFLTLAILCQPASAAPPAPTYYSGSAKAVIPLRRDAAGKLYLTALVHGVPLTLLIDTGGSQLLDLNVARRIGLPVGATTGIGYGVTGGAAVRTGVMDIELGGIRVTNLPTSCPDLTELRRTVEATNEIPFDGIIGSELLSALRARVDYDRLTLEIRRPTAASIAEELKRRETLARP